VLFAASAAFASLSSRRSASTAPSCARAATPPTDGKNHEGTEEAVGRASAQQRDTGRTGLGDGKQLETGRSIYGGDCVGCHGADGEGNGVTLVPRLAGQHYRYLLRQLHDTLEQRRPNMPPPHPQLLDKLGVAELTGLADYLARLNPPRRVVTP
jgi:cytochrome c553